MSELKYIKTEWIEDETPLSPENMNHIEDGIEAVTEATNKAVKDGDHIITSSTTVEEAYELFGEIYFIYNENLILISKINENQYSIRVWNKFKYGIINNVDGDNGFESIIDDTIEYIYYLDNENYLNYTVQKTTNPYSIYGNDFEGNPFMYFCNDNEPAPGDIPMYDMNAQLKVQPTPINNDDAASKKYVDLKGFDGEITVTGAMPNIIIAKNDIKLGIYKLKDSNDGNYGGWISINKRTTIGQHEVVYAVASWGFLSQRLYYYDGISIDNDLNLHDGSEYATEQYVNNNATKLYEHYCKINNDSYGTYINIVSDRESPYTMGLDILQDLQKGFSAFTLGYNAGSFILYCSSVGSSCVGYIINSSGQIIQIDIDVIGTDTVTEL